MTSAAHLQQPFSWKALGVDVHGLSVTLGVNYRTSHQIREAADRLIPGPVSDAQWGPSLPLATSAHPPLNTLKQVADPNAPGRPSRSLSITSSLPLPRAPTAMSRLLACAIKSVVLPTLGGSCLRYFVQVIENESE